MRHVLCLVLIAALKGNAGANDGMRPPPELRFTVAQINSPTIPFQAGFRANNQEEPVFQFKDEQQGVLVGLDVGFPFRRWRLDVEAEIGADLLGQSSGAQFREFDDISAIPLTLRFVDDIRYVDVRNNTVIDDAFVLGLPRRGQYQSQSSADHWRLRTTIGHSFQRNSATLQAYIGLEAEGRGDSSTSAINVLGFDAILDTAFNVSGRLDQLIELQNTYGGLVIGAETGVQLGNHAYFQIEVVGRTGIARARADAVQNFNVSILNVGTAGDPLPPQIFTSGRSAGSASAEASETRHRRGLEFELAIGWNNNTVPGIELFLERRQIWGEATPVLPVLPSDPAFHIGSRDYAHDIVGIRIVERY